MVPFTLLREASGGKLNTISPPSVRKKMRKGGERERGRRTDEREWEKHRTERQEGRNGKKI